MATERCIIENCTNGIDYPILGVCKTCYSGLAYWRGRSVADKRKRLRQIERLDGRMKFMIDHPNVAPKRKRK